MNPQSVSKKRRLPAWMKAISNQDGGPSDGDSCALAISGQAKHSKADLKNGSGAHKAVSVRSSACAASDVISDSMPFLDFPGTVVYCDNFSDCACYCEEILASIKNSDNNGSATPVGFDMEWPVTFARGAASKTALIQMCISKERCYLFHVSAIGKFPKLLGSLISDQKLLLVGLNIEADLWKIERDFDVRVKPLIDRGSVVDVGKLANKKLKSSERWDLNGLCKNILRKRLNKDEAVRCGSWADVPLSQTQRDYAVADAYAGLKLYQTLASSNDFPRM